MNFLSCRSYSWVVILIITILSGCSDPAEKKAAATVAPLLPEVSVLEVSFSEATLTKDLPGRLQAWRTAQVRARVDGIVEKRLFVEGSDVSAGALLYQIDARAYQSAFDAAKAEVAVARLLVDRYQPLLEIRAVSKQEFDAAEAKLKQAEALFAKAQLDLENTRVPAPISGRIGRSLITEGALVARGEATPLTVIEQINPLYVNFTQSSTELTALRDAINSGLWKEADRTKVELVLENGHVYSLPGKLLFSDLAVDPGTGSVSLRAQFPNPKRELLPGMFVRVRFPQMIAKQVFRIPQRAVRMSQSGLIVLVVDKDGKISSKSVNAAGMSGNEWLITSGLVEGDQVVVEGHMARPGSTVKTVPWIPKSSSGEESAGNSPDTAVQSR
jgi:membrane fusion protein (multidrug efflux system)